MTKPQALPLAIPFAAFYLCRQGLAGSARAALIGLGTVVALWAPFVAANGPANYLRSLGDYSATFAVLSLRAWNPWWVLQEIAGHGQLISDSIPFAGPLTLRWVGVAVAGILVLAASRGVWRRPTGAGLAWGLAATSLAAFVGFTTMHERYAYPALVFLVLVWPNRLAVGCWVVLAIAASLNIVAAVPPHGGPGALVDVGGWVGGIGAVTLSAAFAVVLAGLYRQGEERSGGRDRLEGTPGRRA